MKTHSLQTSKTDHFLSPSPVNWGPEMRKGRRLDGTAKTELGRHAGGRTGASRSHSDWGRDRGTGRGTEGEESQETYHNDVLMLLGSQVCVLRD